MPPSPMELNRLAAERSIGRLPSAAVDYVRTGDWADPAYLEALREKATRVRIEDGVTPAPVALHVGER